MRRPRSSAVTPQTDAASQAATSAAGSDDTATAPLPTPASNTATPAADNESDELIFRHNGVTLNADTRTAELHDTELDLTRTEFDLLQSLLSSKRRVRSKADLVRELRDEEYVANDFVSESEERAIEVHFANLRRKLSDDPKRPRWVETVRGVGYRLPPARDSEEFA